MAKKLDVREYQCELIKVVDGDTIDCYIDMGFNLKIKKRVRYMGIDTWESRTRNKEEKVKGLAAKARNKELLEENVFKLKSIGTGKFGRVLGEIFVDPAVVGEHIQECISSPDSDIDLSKYNNKAVLIVNFASKFGFTKQYGDLQKLWDTYKDDGLIVIGVPSIQFGSQVPGKNEEIKEFCEVK